MHDILLTVLILFSGFVPVGIALWYSKKLLETANSLYEMGKAERGQTITDVKAWLLDKEFTDHIRLTITGAYGRDCRKAKDAIEGEAILQGLPPPVKKTISKGVEGFMEDYGMSKKTAKGIGAAIDMILSRPSKAQKEQQDASILKYAKELGYDPAVLDVSGPKV